ncbi:MAG: hypothetical protein M1818_002397 [Claussenomyces sp. TS43310]|nr:MAG: hypothetical protein M1818_002397 [Claussenomyces sp. TS43310]
MQNVIAVPRVQNVVFTFVTHPRRPLALHTRPHPRVEAPAMHAAAALGATPDGVVLAADFAEADGTVFRYGPTGNSARVHDARLEDDACVVEVVANDTVDELGEKDNVLSDVRLGDVAPELVPVTDVKGVDIVGLEDALVDGVTDDTVDGLDPVACRGRVAVASLTVTDTLMDRAGFAEV